jgi:hypothetical protein
MYSGAIGRGKGPTVYRTSHIGPITTARAWSEPSSRRRFSGAAVWEKHPVIGGMHASHAAKLLDGAQAVGHEDGSRIFRSWGSRDSRARDLARVGPMLPTGMESSSPTCR